MTRRVLVLDGSRWASHASPKRCSPTHPRPTTWRPRPAIRATPSGSSGSAGIAPAGAPLAHHRDRRRRGRLDTVGSPVLVESITAWLARAMDECGCWTGDEKHGELDARIDALTTAWAATSRFAVAVADEVGLGIVPDTTSGRRFRDTLGL